MWRILNVEMAKLARVAVLNTATVFTLLPICYRLYCMKCYYYVWFSSMTGSLHNHIFLFSPMFVSFLPSRWYTRLFLCQTANVWIIARDLCNLWSHCIRCISQWGPHILHNQTYYHQYDYWVAPYLSMHHSVVKSFSPRTRFTHSFQYFTTPI